MRATSSWSSRTETRRRSSSVSSASGTGRRARSSTSSDDRALPVLVLVDDVDLVEAVRQIRRLAHVVDRLPDGQIRRHRDELGLHPPAGGIFRIISRLRSSATRSVQRQLLEDLLLLLLVEGFEQLDRVVGFELADALGDGLRRQLLEDLLAHALVDFVQRGEVEIGAGQLDQADAVVGLERLDQIAEIGLVQLGDAGAQRGAVAGLDRMGNLLDEFVTNFAVFIAHRDVVEYRSSRRTRQPVHMFIHGAPRRLTGWNELV